MKITATPLEMVSNSYYCHCLEIAHIDELYSTVEQLIGEWKEEFTASSIIQFFTTLEVYYFSEEENKEEEEAIYNFEMRKEVVELLRLAR